MFFFAGLSTDYGFVAMLRLMTMFFPFFRIRPEIPATLAWLLTVGYWVFLATMIGKVGRPPSWLRMALVTLLAVMILAAEIARRTMNTFQGHRRHTRLRSQIASF